MAMKRYEDGTWENPAIVDVDPTLTIPKLIRQRRDADPTQVAIERRQSLGSWRKVRIDEFVNDTEAVARGLMGIGLQPGERLAILAPTSYEWAVLDVAALSCGAVTVPIYETDSAQQIAHILADAEVRIVITATRQQADLVDSVKGDGVRRIMALDQGALTEIRNAAEGVDVARVYEAMNAVSLSDVMTIIYTSGTTGVPKGVVLTHGNFIESFLQAYDFLPDLINNPKSRTLLFLPVAHVLARFVMYALITGKGRIAFSPDTSNLLGDIKTFQPSLLLAVPRVLEKVYNGASAKAGGGFKGRMFAWAAKQARETSAKEAAAAASAMEAVPVTPGAFDPAAASGGDRPLALGAADAEAAAAALREAEKEAAKAKKESSDAADGDGDGGDGGDGGAGGLGDGDGGLGGEPRVRVKGPSFDQKTRLKAADAVVLGKIKDLLGPNLKTIICGGAPLSGDLANFFRGLGITLLQGYGLSETTGPITVEIPSDYPPDAVGFAWPGNQLRIAEDGELEVRGVSVTRGYHNLPDETAKAFHDGWFRTGDLGAIDAAGHLRITGRKKELIVTAGGKNVSPEVLEESLSTHPLIGNVIVVGDGRPYIGALITLDPEMLPVWLRQKGLPTVDAADAAALPEVKASLARAIARANQAVSRAESIRRFRIVNAAFTVENGYLTPSLKLKRSKVLSDYAGEVDALYAGDPAATGDARNGNVG